MPKHESISRHCKNRRLSAISSCTPFIPSFSAMRKLLPLFVYLIAIAPSNPIQAQVAAPDGIVIAEYTLTPTDEAVQLCWRLETYLFSPCTGYSPIVSWSYTLNQRQIDGVKGKTVNLTAAQTSYYLEVFDLANIFWTIDGVITPYVNPTPDPSVGDNYGYGGFFQEYDWEYGGFNIYYLVTPESNEFGSPTYQQYQKQQIPDPPQFVPCKSYCWVSTIMSISVPANATSMSISGQFGDSVIAVGEGGGGDANKSGVQLFLNIPCPVPTITSITPATWFAGKSQNITITGTGFVPTANNTPACPATTLITTAADGTVIPLTNVNVASDTQITASVAPTEDTKSQLATVKVTGNPAATKTGGILNNQILCSGASMSCNGSVISKINSTPTTQDVDAGQQVALTTPPLPSGYTIASQQWTVGTSGTLGGINIGGYTASRDSATVQEVNDVDGGLTANSITYYWVYPSTSVPVSYQYCVNTPSDGAQCSDTTTAKFNVTGPTNVQMTSEAYSTVSIVRLIDQQPCLPGDTDLFMSYGIVTGYSEEYCPSYGGTTGTPGMKFTAPEDTFNGSYSFVQIIDSDKTLYSTGKYCGAFTASGLDGGKYPYPVYDGTNYTADAPDSVLGQKYTLSSRNFAATMYQLWTSSVPSSIPVPVGYQKWYIQASTTNPSYPTGQSWTTPTWTNLGNNGDFVEAATQSTSLSYPYGYPLWSGRTKQVWIDTKCNAK